MVACSMESPSAAPNVIYGQALIAHFAFHTQRDYLEKETNLLNTYRDLSRQVNVEALTAPRR